MRKTLCLLASLCMLTMSVCALSWGCTPGTPSDSDNTASSAVTEAGDFKIDKAQCEVEVGGTSEVITVTRNNEPYFGLIVWSSLDDGIAKVVQGRVVGVNIGETQIRATIEENGVIYTLKCNVKVHPEITAQLDLMTVYAGAEDVSLKVDAGLVTTGATSQFVDVKDESGVSYKDRVKRVDNDELVLTNDVENPLTAGKYFIDYRFSMSGYSKTLSRELNVKKFDRAEDAYLLDPLDGNSTVRGIAVVNNYLNETPASSRPDPGAYVKYTEERNTGATGKGLNENVAEFRENLIKSGYNGYLKEGDAGYDTVYRMYLNISSKGEAGPTFYFDLLQTADPIWQDLSLLGDANLSVWVRLLQKENEETGFVAKNVGWMYPFKVQNTGGKMLRDSTGNVVSAPGVMSTDGGWINFKMPVSKIAQMMNDTRNLGLGFWVSSNVQGEFYFDLYSVEIDVLGKLTAPTNKADVAVPIHYAKLFDSYEYVVKNELGISLFKGTPGDTEVTVDTGVYTIEYTMKKGNVSIATATRVLQSGVICDITSSNQLVASAWDKAKNVRSFVKAEEAVGIPATANLRKTEYMQVDVNQTGGEDFLSINIKSVIDHMQDLKDSDYIGIWVWIGSTSAMDIERKFGFYLSEGGTHYGGSELVNKTLYSLENYESFPWMSTKLQEPTKYNEWSMIKITVGEIRALINGHSEANLSNYESNSKTYSAIKAKKNVVPDTLCLQIGKTGDKNVKYYYYSAEFFTAEGNINLEDKDNIGSDNPNWD